MALPKAVQRQKEEAEQLEKEMLEQQAQGDNPPVETPPAVTTPVETPPVETPPVETPPVETPPVPPTDENVSRAEYNKLQQAYDTLLGRFRKEVKQLSEDKTYLQGQLQGLRERLDVLEKAPITGGKTTPSVTTPPANEKLAKFQHDFPDIYEAMVEYFGQAKGTGEDVTKRIEQVEEKVVQSEAIKFFDALALRVPDWEKLNNDPNYIDWLMTKQKGTPYTKHQLLNLAVQNLDVNDAAMYFEEYKAEMGIKAPPVTSSEIPPVPPTAPNAQDKTKRVAPTGVSGAAPPAGGGGEKKIFTQKEIDDFYRDKALGRLRHRQPAEILAQEKEYELAAQENRIKRT